MRNIKKLLVAFLLVVTAFTLTSCTELNKVTTYFEEQGYIRYQYNQNGGSTVWALHDLLQAEEVLRMEEEANATSTTTVSTTSGVITVDIGDSTTTTTEEEDELEHYGFNSYVFSNGELMVVVMEFDSEEILQEFFERSEVLQTYFEGQDEADYINGNCILVVNEEFIDSYDLFVDIFHGRLEPIEITETTTTEATTETTTA